LKASDKKIKIATCQFAVGSSIKRNSSIICRMILKACRLKADIVHFSECSLSGYVGTDFPDFNGYNWGLLEEKTREIQAIVKNQNELLKTRTWVVLGSSHRLTEPNKPHNCLYLIDPKGRIVNRYDKRFCTSGDLRRFTPGNRSVNFKIKGVKCSLLICFDLRFPELYRDLYKQKIHCVLQSFYNAKQAGTSVHTHIMRQTMQAHAACNHFWVSMANSSGFYSPYPSSFIEPDGKITGHLIANKPGLMVNTVDLSRQFYDPMKKFRDIAVAGHLTNGLEKINDTRSKNVTSF
jgi:deaminated glutathione amidase